MAYLIFDTELDATDRSRSAWEDRLGRPKNPEDVTEFLNGWSVGLDGRTALDVTGMALRGTEETNLIDTLPADNWPSGAIQDA
jgi:hypothetical protein